MTTMLAGAPSTPTATTHLAKLDSGGLLLLRRQSRQKCFSLVSEKVANLLEPMMGLTADTQTGGIVTGPRDEKMRKARVCYNHLEGDVGIKLYDSLISNRHLILRDQSPLLSKKGQQFVIDFGIGLVAL